jgi:hypothetical protein
MSVYSINYLNRLVSVAKHKKVAIAGDVSTGVRNVKANAGQCKLTFARLR